MWKSFSTILRDILSSSFAKMNQSSSKTIPLCLLFLLFFLLFLLLLLCLLLPAVVIVVVVGHTVVIMLIPFVRQLREQLNKKLQSFYRFRQI